MLSPASFHSNTRGLNTTTVQLKAMGILLGVPLQSLVMGITLPGEIVILQNAEQVILISFLNNGTVPLFPNIHIINGDRFVVSCKYLCS